MALQTIDEESSAYLTVTFKDKDGQPAAPSSASYRIDCLTNDQEVRADTDLTPAPSVEIHLDSNDNAIINQDKQTETRLVTVKATYGANDGINAPYKYNVRNLKKVT